MTQQQIYQEWKPTVLGKVLNVDGVDNGQCTQVALSYGLALFPDKTWQELFPPVPAAKDMFATYDSTYFEAIINDHTNLSQLPQQGDLLVFDATPQDGYADTYNNPYGHIGICDGASARSYVLLQQNAPQFGSAVNLTVYPWRFRPCLGWLRPKLPVVPEYYTVVEGDTVDGICGKYGIDKSNDYAVFRALNPNIADINKIFPNEHVRIA